MIVESTPIVDLKVIIPKVYHDERGYFFESFSSKHAVLGEAGSWIQDNESKSTKGVLRGLHYQTGKMAQAKLVRAVLGEIFDVAVDLRPDSSTYGHWFGIILNDHNKKQLFIPRGFAHGFVVLSEMAIFSYKCDNYYTADAEAGIHYADKSLNIEWPLPADKIIISPKDSILPDFGRHKAVYG